MPCNDAENCVMSVVIRCPSSDDNSGGSEGEQIQHHHHPPSENDCYVYIILNQYWESIRNTNMERFFFISVTRSVIIMTTNWTTISRCTAKECIWTLLLLPPPPPTQTASHRPNSTWSKLIFWANSGAIWIIAADSNRKELPIPSSNWLEWWSKSLVAQADEEESQIHGIICLFLLLQLGSTTTEVLHHLLSSQYKLPSFRGMRDWLTVHCWLPFV